MTGFGKASDIFSGFEMDIEIKTVNHRFTDIQCRLPSQYAQWESMIREKLKEKIKRGRVECVVTIKLVSSEEQTVHICWERLTAFVDEMQQGWEKRFGTTLSAENILAQAMAHSDLFLEQTESNTPAVSEEEFFQLLDHALENLQESRATEGAALRRTIQQLTKELPMALDIILQSREEFEQEAFLKLQKKLMEFLDGTEISEERLLTEVAILIDKSDIQEEVDRMKIHIKQLNSLLDLEKPVGRELDFLIQEMNREVNTMGAKSSLIEIKNAVIQIKAVLEKIREQIQNIE